MPQYIASTLLTSLQQQTNNSLETIRRWRKLPLETLLFSPEPGEWNAIECLEHLNSYGRYYLPEIEKAIEAAAKRGGVANNKFTAGMLGNYFTKMMTPGANGRVKKMRAPKDHLPKQVQNAAVVLDEMEEQLRKLMVLLEQARAIDLNKARVPISISRLIKLKLGDVFMFISAHNLRHILQAGRAMEASGNNNLGVTNLKSTRQVNVEQAVG